MPSTEEYARVIAADLDRVYAALVDTVALTQWMAPAGMTASIDRFDLRPVGRMVLTYTDRASASGKSSADTDIVVARFIEIVPGVRVAYEVDFVSDDFAYVGTMTTTWEVTAVVEGSRVDITADNVPDGISAQDHAAGMTLSLTDLAACLDDLATNGC